MLIAIAFALPPSNRAHATTAKTQRTGSAVAMMIALLGAVSTARAQWTVTSLHPIGAGADSSTAFGVSGLQQVGALEYRSEANLSLYPYAAMWNGTAGSWVDLSPPNTGKSMALDASGSLQVGFVSLDDSIGGHASLWSGTAASWVDLSPSGSSRSEAYGVSGAQQVGYAQFGSSSHAGIWSGTADSWRDLNPAGSENSSAQDTAGTQQAGYAEFDGVRHAGLWSGDAESWVDLHPQGSEWSMASDILGTQQVGTARFAGEYHAGLWNGTSESWVDLHPAGASRSSVEGLFGTLQVGSADFEGLTRASLWSGTAESRIDLDSLAPSGFTHTWATGIWSDGNTIYVVGVGSAGPRGPRQALVWSRQVPEPATAALVVLTGLLCRTPRAGRRARCR